VPTADVALTNAISFCRRAKAIETSTPIREVTDKMIARQSILLNAAQKIQSALGAMKVRYFDLLDFTAGYHQSSLNPASRKLNIFRVADDLYQWNLVAMGLKGDGLWRYY
jgi:hypothetical protein